MCTTQAMTKMDGLMAGLLETIEHHSRKIRQLQLLTWWQSEQVDGIAMKERSQQMAMGWCLPERLGLHKARGWIGDCGGRVWSGRDWRTSRGGYCVGGRWECSTGIKELYIQQCNPAALRAAQQTALELESYQSL